MVAHIFGKHLNRSECNTALPETKIRRGKNEKLL